MDGFVLWVGLGEGVRETATQWISGWWFERSVRSLKVFSATLGWGRGVSESGWTSEGCMSGLTWIAAVPEEDNQYRLIAGELDVLS